MQVTLTDRFVRDAVDLSAAERERLFSAILNLPAALKEIHRHSGLGLRKIHPSGIFEARIGLGLRMILGLQKDTAILHRIGNHDEITRYLKGL